MKASYIVSGVRTPVGSHGGALGAVRPDDLAAHVIRELIVRNPNLDSTSIDDVIMGCANQAGEDNRNVARMAVLLAGLPVSVPGETVNRLCASGLSAIASASRLIAVGEGDVVLAGGVESMTRAPFVVSKSSSAFARDVQMYDTSIGWRFINPSLHAMYGTDTMGETAENVASKYSITRSDQDIFSYRSQQKTAAAQAAGRFECEIAPVVIPGRKGAVNTVSEDEHPRPGTSLEVLGKLRPAFRLDGSGTVTAGNSSGINDGAAVLLIASEDAIKRFAFIPRARIVASAAIGVEPATMGIGPVPASQLALKRAGLSIQEMGVIELNEAFAAQSLACIRGLGLEDDDPRVNINGGAIALGHPLGMSGARLVQTATEQLHISNERYALCTMCIGVGQGYAMIIERV